MERSEIGKLIKNTRESQHLIADYTFYAVGCQGAITSRRRSSLIICDDLIKSIGGDRQS